MLRPTTVQRNQPTSGQKDRGMIRIANGVSRLRPMVIGLPLQQEAVIFAKESLFRWGDNLFTGDVGGRSFTFPQIIKLVRIQIVNRLD